MRSIWKGSIAFGLVNVPVKVYTATTDHDIRFHQVHAEDRGRIKYDRVCTVCGKSVSFSDIDKQWESPEGQKVVLSDKDLAALPVAEKHEIPVLQFVPSDQIDPIFYDKTYYLEPDSTTPKAYVLLAATLERIDRTALVHFTLRQKTRLAAMRVRDGMLILQTLLWPDEVRSVSFESLDEAKAPRPQEIKMAETLVESMSEDFDPEQFTDEYQVELQRLLEEAAARGDGKAPERSAPRAEESDAEVVDLVAALQRSLEAGDARGGGSGSKQSSRAATARKTGASGGSRTGQRKAGGTAAGRKSAESTTGQQKSTPKKSEQKRTRKGA